MNERLPTCGAWSEAISLLAADCLTPDEEVETRRHMAVCPICRERFDQLHLVCHGLRAAKSEQPSSTVADAVTRAMIEIGKMPQTARDESAFRTKSRWRFVAIAAIAIALLIAAGWQTSLLLAPHPDAAVQDPSKLMAGQNQESTRTVNEATVSSNQPTWLSLQHAAAKSDEAFDALLGRGGTALFSPLNKTSLLQETNL